MLIKLSIFVFILPSILGILFFKNLPEILKLFVIVVTINGCVDCYGYFLLTQGVNTSSFLNIYIIPHLILWALPVYLLFENRSYKNVVLLSVFVTVCLVGMFIFNPENSERINGKALAIVGSNLIIINLIYIYYTAVKSELLSFTDHPMFPISCAIILYQTFNTIIFALTNEIDPESISFLWGFKYVTYTFLHLVFTLVFWRYGKLRN